MVCSWEKGYASEFTQIFSILYIIFTLIKVIIAVILCMKKYDF